MIDINNLSISYDRKIIDDVSFRLHPGVVNVLMGRNGSGKSTMLNAIAGLLPYEGEIKTSGEISYLNQNVNTDVNFSVFETILMGKVNNLGIRLKQEDYDDTEEIIDLLNLRDFRDKRINRLSGGEVQKVLIAQALIKRPDILLLDEPASALDLKNQYEILDIISQLTKAMNLTTVITIHQIDLIERFGENIVLINDGKIYKQGNKYEVFSKKMFREIYDIDALITEDNGHLMFLFDKKSNNILV